MKQLVLFTYILLTSLLLSCESETISSSTSNVVGTISTRVSNDITSLPTNSQALFHTSSGTSIFTFDGNHWNGDQSIFSFSSATPNVLTALYPAYNGEKPITENPYTNNELEDVLIAQSTYTNEPNIELTFRHLFSTLAIHILSPLRESITRISLEVPIIESLNADGSFSLSGTHQILPELNTEGSYTFIIPSQDNCALTLHLTIGEETISHPITHSFKSGYKYECNVKEPGIYNAEDLIEFSKIINGESSKRKWSDFGYIEKGDTIYCLQNDITFTDTDCDKFTPIGNHPNRPFAALFNGNGFVISGLKLQPCQGIVGLFGRITPKGAIKKLHLDNCSISSTETIGSGLGILTGVCYGTITNCSVKGSSISASSTSPAGGLTGYARLGSNITNCYVQDCSISAGGYVGGVVGYTTEGNITNCYSASNSITRKSSFCGGFCGYAESCNITNCYVYNLTLKTDEHKGQFIGYGKNSSVSYCYTNTSSLTLIGKNVNETSTVSSSKTYNSSTFMINELHIVNVLNQWITNNQSSYENYTFTTWKEDTSGTLPAIFQ